MTEIPAETAAMVGPGSGPASRSLWATALMRLKRNKAAMASLFILAIYVFLAGVVGSLLSKRNSL